jgi:uncharacterized protein (TIGR02266 family)
VSVEVSIESEHNFYAGVSDDISIGGLFVASDAPPQTGTVVEVSLLLPGSDAPLEVTGVVRWVREVSIPRDGLPAGCGIAWANIAKSDLEAISRFVQQRETILFEDAVSGATGKLRALIEPSSPLPSPAKPQAGPPPGARLEVLPSPIPPPSEPWDNGVDEELDVSVSPQKLLELVAESEQELVLESEADPEPRLSEEASELVSVAHELAARLTSVAAAVEKVGPEFLHSAAGQADQAFIRAAVARLVHSLYKLGKPPSE